MQKLLITVSVAGLGVAVPAHAGFINLNAPYDAGPTFTPLPGNLVQVTGGASGIVAGYQTAAECPAGNCLETASASFDTNFTGLLTSNYNYTTSGTGGFSFNGTIFDPSGSGKVIATDMLSATIMWNSIYFVDDGSVYAGPSLSGTGIVTSSTGDDAFEADFPVGGTFSIGADFLWPSCAEFPFSCGPDQVEGTELIAGSVTPVPAPSPLIGKPGPLMLACMALLGLVRRYWIGVSRG